MAVKFAFCIADADAPLVGGYDSEQEAIDEAKTAIELTYMKRETIAFWVGEIDGDEVKTVEEYEHTVAG